MAGGVWREGCGGRGFVSGEVFGLLEMLVFLEKNVDELKVKEQNKRRVLWLCQGSLISFFEFWRPRRPDSSLALAGGGDLGEGKAVGLRTPSLWDIPKRPCWFGEVGREGFRIYGGFFLPSSDSSVVWFLKSPNLCDPLSIEKIKIHRAQGLQNP